MAINKRIYKTFDALLDDLTKKVSLPFGVRSVTTPHGVHNINTLEQLEDGGTYFCSDKKHIKPINVNAAGKKTATRQGNNPTTTHQHIAQRARKEGGQGLHAHAAHKQITLIKNGNVSTHYSIVLNRRNIHSFRGFLEEISELMQYNVTKLYTTDGKNIGTLQALFQSPNVLVCVGHESFKPITHEAVRRTSEKLPSLSRRSHAISNTDTKKNDNFGLETKKSIIHPRSSPSRSSRFSLSSDKFNPHALSSSNNDHVSFVDSHPHENNPELFDLIDDNIEKKVHVDKDGSLTVEMKVQFRLLNRETLQWSTQIRRSSLAGKTMNECLCSVDNHATEQTDQRNCSDGSFCPCSSIDAYVSKYNGAEPEEQNCENCDKCCQGYDIWKNPLYADNITEVNVRNGRYTHSSYSCRSPCRRVAYKRESVESMQTMSSEEYTHFVQQIESHSEIVEKRDEDVEYSSLSHCSRQSRGYTPTSKVVGYHDSRASISRSQSANGYHTSSRCSTNSCQDLHDEDLSCVSAHNSIASSKGKVPVKTTAIAESDKLASSFTSLAETPVDLKDAHTDAADDEQASSISKSIHCAKCKKQINQKNNSEGRSLTASLNGSKYVTNVSKESVQLKPIHSNTKSSCHTPFNGTNNIGNTEEGKAYSVVSSCSIHSDNISNKELYEDTRRADDISLNSAKSKTRSHIKIDLNKIERHYTQVYGTNYDTQGRPTSNTASLSSTKNKKEPTRDAEDDSTSYSTTSLEPLAEGKGNNVSCSDGLSAKSGMKLKFQSATSTPEQMSVSQYAKHITTNSNDKSQRSSELLNVSDSVIGSEKAISEKDGSSSTSQSGNLKAPEDGKTSNEVQTLWSTSDLQIETNIGIEQERSRRAGSNCSAISKLSGIKAEGECVELHQVESEPEQYGISKLKNVVNLEVLPCKTNEEATIVINSDTENTCIQCVPHSFEQKEKAGGKSTPLSLTEFSQKSNRSLTPDKVLEKTGSALKPLISGAESVLSEGSENPKEKNSIKSDNDKESETVKEKCKHRNIKKSKNKISTHAIADACGRNDLTPSVLPNSSLEDVVHEWLKNIPSENKLMKYDSTEEFQDKCEKSPKVITEGEEIEETTLEEKLHKEESVVSNLKCKEENYSEAVILECKISPKLEGKDSAQHNVKEVDIFQSKPISSHCSTTKQLQDNTLPTNVHSPVEVIKVFLSARHKSDRSNSLPDLNLAHEKNLSHSAKALLTCLASRQFFDKDSSDTANKFNNTDNSAQNELLSILKSLWYTDIAKKGEGEISQVSVKHSKTFKGHNSADDNITPVSSSGVDVNSGSGGSGDSGVSGAMDVSLTTKRKNSDLKVKSCMTKANDVSKQPSLMTNSFEESSEMCTKPNEKNGKESLTSTESAITEASQRNAKLRNCKNRMHKSEESTSSEKRSPSRNSELSHSDIAPFSPVTPDIASRVQWNSGEYSNDEDLAQNVENKGKNIQDTIQNLQEPHDPGTDKNTLDMEEIIYQNNQIGHLEENNLKEINIVSDKTEKNDSIDRIKESQEIISDHAAPVVLDKPKPVQLERKSSDPNPVWLLKLLKKLEKQFITHYVDAMKDFKIRWDLEADGRLDQMIEDLREDVSRRIKGSIKRELMKVQGRAGQKKPFPPQEPRRCKSSEQTEQRRRRLKAIYKTPKESDHEHSTNDISSLVSDEDLDFQQMVDDKVDAQDQLGLDNFCPCDSCSDKHKAQNLAAYPMQTNTSLIKNFDLREILRMKRNRANEQITKQIVTEGNEELFNIEIKENCCDESEILQSVQNKMDHGVQNNEQLNTIRENVNVNKKFENQNLDRIIDQRELIQVNMNHKDSQNVEDIGEKIEQVTICNDDQQNKVKVGESAKIKSTKVQNPNEDQGDWVYKRENLHKTDKADSQCAECETSNKAPNDEETSTTIVKCKVQNEENHLMLNDTDPETRNNSKLEEPNSDSQWKYKISESNTKETVKNIRTNEIQNLDNVASDFSDKQINSDAIESPNEEMLNMNTKLPGNESIINCPQYFGEETLEDSMKRETVDNVQGSAKEAMRIHSNSARNKSSQMYPESSSDEDRKSIGTSPEVSEDEKDTWNHSDSVPDQKASMENQSKKPIGSEFTEDDLDF
ncbi:retinitis pigmentosa 1-like 1 protein [Narcine bancroftii]|uniref:retinitis pigmentosa 1-like 1 protein n=1 Tax=Narcine bancroftii TaxID=1343680 RepID=UPI0038321A24